MRIVEATVGHIPAWINLRNALWPGTISSHGEEALEILEADHMACFLCYDGAALIGFIEGGIYTQEHTRYGHIEGWYVVPDRRGQGIGHALMEQLESWFLHHSIRLFHSDTDPIAYPTSTTAHERNGYQHLYDLRIFLKRA